MIARSAGRAIKTLQPLIARIEADIMASDLQHAASRQHVAHAPAGQ
jgi:hypothetical protein